jgi:hypothetical protein
VQRFPCDGGGEVVLLGTVHGLVAEAERVREAFAKVQPRAVALGASPEAVGALLRYQKSDEHDPFDDLPDAEIAYSLRLAAFGEVDLPSPDFAEAIALARAADAPVHGVDLTEEAYVETYTKEVGAWALLRYGRVQRGLAKRPPKAADPRAFSLAWDAKVRRVKGIARVEAAREAQIAKGACLLAATVGGPVLLVVDVPREGGVAERLRPRGTDAA